MVFVYFRISVLKYTSTVEVRIINNQESLQKPLIAISCVQCHREVLLTFILAHQLHLVYYFVGKVSRTVFLLMSEKK